MDILNTKYNQTVNSQHNIDKLILNFKNIKKILNTIMIEITKIRTVPTIPENENEDDLEENAGGKRKIKTSLTKRKIIKKRQTKKRKPKK